MSENQLLTYIQTCIYTQIQNFDNFAIYLDYMYMCMYLWEKVLKYGPRKICGRQPQKVCSVMVCLNRPYNFKLFKDFLP